MNKHLDSVIEQGLLILLLKGFQDSMGITEEMLKEAEKTADTIVSVRNKFQQSAGPNSMNNVNPLAGMVAGMAGIQPPLARPNRINRPRVSSNEQLLNQECESLKKQLDEKDEEIRAVTAKMTEAYAIVEEFRDEFSKIGEGISEQVFDLQARVYEAISGTTPGE